jgi:hypothetical protein
MCAFTRHRLFIASWSPVLRRPVEITANRRHFGLKMQFTYFLLCPDKKR